MCKRTSRKPQFILCIFTFIEVRVIHGCVRSLESLDPELVPATVACRRDINNRAALEHLRLLRREWSDNVKALVDVIDDLTDANIFISVSGRQEK